MVNNEICLFNVAYNRMKMDQKEIRLTTMILTVVSNNGRNRTRDLMGDVQFNETRALEEIVP